MTNTHPHTVDISAESVSPSTFGTAVAQTRNYSEAARQSLAIDAVLLLLSLMLGGLFSIVASSINLPADVSSNVPLLPSAWLLVFMCSAPALLWGFIDILSTLSNPAALPYARSQSSRQAIYFQRIHTLLLGFYVTAIVVALCWSAVAMPLVSKLFVSAIFSFALYALGRSIPSRRNSFIVSGILFLVVLIATQVFIVMRLEADAGVANQRVLNELVDPDPRDKDDFFQ